MTGMPLASASSGRPGGGIDDRRCSDHDHDVGVAHRIDRFLPGGVGQRLAEPHHVGPDQATAGMLWRLRDLDRLRHLGQVAVVFALATVATEFEKAAVQVVHVLTACPLVQVVDVLGDDVHLGVVLPRRDGPMAVVRLDPLHEVVPPQIPRPYLLRVPVPALCARYLVWVDFRPQPGLDVAERRNPALCGNTCSAEHSHLHITKLAGDARY